MARHFCLQQARQRQKDIQDDGGDNTQIGPSYVECLVTMTSGAVKGRNLVEDRLAEVIH